MPIETQQLIKDIIFNLNAYVYWYEEFKSEGYWESQNKANQFYNRIAEQLPLALDYFRTAHCDSLTN